MVAADHDRRRDLAGADHLVESQPETVTLAVPEPADPCRQALEGDLLAGQLDPPMQTVIVGKLLEHRPIGGRDVGGIARQRNPAERAFALAEQRADVCRQEARIVERPVEATELGLGAQAVAVVEDLAALVEEPDHRPAVRRHAVARPADELLRIGARQLGGRFRA